MCGRFTLDYLLDELERETELRVAADYLASFNIAPTQTAAVILNTEPEIVQMVRWGLVPAWSTAKQSAGYPLINARAESLSQKPTFRGLIAARRCVVLATGYFEWKKTGATKRPYRIAAKRGLLYFAGLWTEATQDDGAILRSFTIITVAPNEELAQIHDRMPALLTRSEAMTWLAEPDLALLRTTDTSGLAVYPVSTLVNSPRNNVPEILAPISV